MKYKWRVVWSDGTVDTCSYAVEKQLAEWGAQKAIRETHLYGGSHGEPVSVELLPERS